MAKNHAVPMSGVNSDGRVVSVRENEFGFLTQLAGWNKFDEVASASLQAQGGSLPKDYRKATVGEILTVWRIAPDRVLVQSDSKPAFQSSDDMVVLDLSEARVRLTLEGEGAAGLLSRVIALDFSETAFPIGTFVQTSLHHVGVLVERHASGRFTLLVPTTWARSLTSLLSDHLAQAA